MIWPPFPPRDGGFFFAVLLPFTCDFAIYSPVFQDGRIRGGIRGNGSKDLSRVSGRAVFVPKEKRGRFGARETQIKLNGLFSSFRTAFPQVVNGE